MNQEPQIIGASIDIQDAKIESSAKTSSENKSKKKNKPTHRKKAERTEKTSLEKANIYEINAYQALIRFERFIEGDPNDILLVISSAKLSPQSQEAISSSAEKLGLGRTRISWASILGQSSQEESISISPNNLHLLVESMDPVSIIVTDIGAMSILSEAYGIGLEADSSNRVACRTCATFSDFEAMLKNSESKQKAWRVLKSLSLSL